MVGSFLNVGVTGISVAVPEQVSDNELYIEIVGERRVKKQAKLTGVERSHISPFKQRTSDLCFASAKKLIEHMGWKLDEISVLVFASQKVNYRLPSTAFLIQKRLGISEDCLVYDINMGCSSANIGIQDVAAHLASLPEGSKGIVICGDVCDEPKKEKDLIPEVIRNNMLFGSGGAAIALEHKEGLHIDYLVRSYGEKYDSIIGFRNTPTHMKGDAVFEFAINDVVNEILDFEKKCVSRDRVDFLVLHQAQKMILDSIVDACDYPDEKVLYSYKEFGNTSGASIPLSICSNRDRFDNEYERFMICGFGVGLSLAIDYITVPAANILPVICTDEYDRSDMQPKGYLWHKSILVFDPEDPRCGVTVEGIMENTCKNIYLMSDDALLCRRLEDVYYFPVKTAPRYDIDAIAAQIHNEDDALSGIVFSCKYLSDADIISYIEFLWNAGCISSDICRVILIDSPGNDMDKHNRLLNLNSSSPSEAITYNMVIIGEDEITYEPRLDHYSTWLRKFVHSSEKEKMSRAYDISNLIYFLVTDLTKNINLSMIRLGTPQIK